jgi:hypothetical protein
MYDVTLGGAFGLWSTVYTLKYFSFIYWWSKLYNPLPIDIFGVLQI